MTRHGWEGEYVGNEFQAWLKPRGIVHEVTTACSPEFSSAAERLNNTLLDMARTMLLHLGNPKTKLWAGAVNSTCFICSRLLAKSSKRRQRPYETIHGNRPRIGPTCVFGTKSLCT